MCVGHEESPNSLMAIIGTKHNLCPGPRDHESDRPGLTPAHNADLRDSHEYFQKRKCGVSGFLQGRVAGGLL